MAFADDLCARKGFANNIKPPKVISSSIGRLHLGDRACGPANIFGTLHVFICFFSLMAVLYGPTKMMPVCNYVGSKFSSLLVIKLAI
ncbi:hypothetical protein V6N13_076325 [Hibiscus sabdariffa]